MRIIPSCITLLRCSFLISLTTILATLPSIFPSRAVLQRSEAKRRKARFGDALIAQSCIDGGVPLLTRERDFRAVADPVRLDLILGS
jgi:predicted nucleic acid-binding protein